MSGEMAPPRTASRWMARQPSLVRLLIALLLGSLVGLWLGFVTNLPLAVLAAIAVVAGIFDLSGMVALWPMSGAETARNATREAFQPIAEEVLVVIAALGSIVAIAILLLLGDSPTRHTAAAIGLAGVFLSWGMLHLMYATRYAEMYYRGTKGGIDFGDDDEPCYRDFFYFSYNLGMTYAVSDNNMLTTSYRVVALRHCLLSYFYGTVILAATINLVGGIVTGG